MDLHGDAIAIWQEGVKAVDSEKLVRDCIQLQSNTVRICGQSFGLVDGSRIEVVGAGKAGAGMTRGLRSSLAELPKGISLGGWVNVPEDCIEDAGEIKLHGARPAGINEPTESGVEGTRQILKRVASLSQQDLCIVLISGGGSALLPAPVSQISLPDKLTVTRTLARSGVPIEQLNTVRSQLSSIKGGGLVRACSAGHIVALIISDVIGDPLHYIASGPTVESEDTPQDALQILHSVDHDRKMIPATVYAFLESQVSNLPRPAPSKVGANSKVVQNHIIGSNAVAVAAAEKEARQRGYEVINLGSGNCGDASEHGVTLMNRLINLRNHSDNQSSPRYCVVAGGETTVELADTDQPRKGGRNQEVVLAAIDAFPKSSDWKNIALISGGTDGEDGPTDAAGAIADQVTVLKSETSELNSSDHLKINNSYPFLQSIDALLKTGPTHTNVMDLAVGLTCTTTTD